MRIYLFLVLAILGMANTRANAQQGDECNNALVINGLPYSSYKQTYYFDNDYSASKFGFFGTENAGKDVVYKFTPSHDMIVNVKVQAAAGFQNNNYAFVAIKKSNCNSSNVIARKKFYTKAGNSYYGGQGVLSNIELEAGETYTIMIAAWKDATGDNLNYNLSITGLVLPVELISFEGRANTGANELNWVTGVQSNNQYHIVERSKDGREWEELAVLDGGGNTTEEAYYSFVDEEPLAVSYYRLKFVDFDDYVEYSPTEVIYQRVLEEVKFNVYPNPFVDYIVVEGKGKSDVVVYDNWGRKLLEKQFVGQQELEMSSFDAGIYYITVASQGEVFQYKVVK